VINHTSGGRELRIGVKTDTQEVRWTFGASDRRAFALETRSVAVDGATVNAAPILRWLLPVESAAHSDVAHILSRATWITAERSGPREILPLFDVQEHTRVGVRGEMAAGLLYWHESEAVPDSLCVAGEIKTLFHQLRAYLRHFFPGSDLKINPIDGANAIALQFKSENKAEFQRPQNVGFGISQVFPVLVALLAAKAGDLLLVENPEVHLHPKAQQDFGYLIAKVAGAGVQCVVETHSDHVLNGMRLATKSGVIMPEKIAVHFFMRAREDGALKHSSPTINADGRFTEWPEGFFDQYDAALAELL
jgi:predicted ATPase